MRLDPACGPEGAEPKMAGELHDWHDFYALLGEASATLIGLMFVAASVGATFFNVEREHAARAFLTPTVLHFSAVLVNCLAATAPARTESSLAALFLATGVAGTAYTGWLWMRMRERGFIKTIDWADRLCYLFFPALIYMLAAAAGIAWLIQFRHGLVLLALTLVFLLLLGIRNAWDMTLWIAVHTENRE